jgi:hypothetical protein
MEKKIQEKLAHLESIAKRPVDQRPSTQRPAKPDSLSAGIRSKEDADMFMAQVDAIVKMAREEYAESKK